MAANKRKEVTAKDIAYRNNYIKENYDRINITFPKGRKEEIKKRAAELGISVSQYVNNLIDADMN